MSATEDLLEKMEARLIAHVDKRFDKLDKNIDHLSTRVSQLEGMVKVLCDTLLAPAERPSSGLTPAPTPVSLAAKPTE